MRFLSAQWIGMLTGGAWLRHASHANGMAERLERRLRPLARVEVIYPAGGERGVRKASARSAERSACKRAQVLHGCGPRRRCPLDVLMGHHGRRCKRTGVRHRAPAGGVQVEQMPGSSTEIAELLNKRITQGHRVGHFIYVHNGLGPLESGSEAPFPSDSPLCSLCPPSLKFLGCGSAIPVVLTLHFCRAKLGHSKAYRSAFNTTGTFASCTMSITVKVGRCRVGEQRRSIRGTASILLTRQPPKRWRRRVF